MKKNEGIISSVDEGSLAEQNGIRPGDRIVSVNDTPVGDIIDLTFALSDEEVKLIVRTSLGETHAHYFQKRFDESLGISMESAVFDHIRQCSNRCSFCFIDQMPPGMRESLYVKDDDYRMSFLYGNFITLTNLTDDDLDRIRRLHLSPLYVSVHTTDGEIRRRMMTNPRAADICAMIEKLIDCGIDLHTQIVLCPGYNDGKVLEETLGKLYSYMPSILSVAVVPVGLSRYRDGLVNLTAFDEAGARRTIAIAEKWQKRARSEYGRSFVYLGDEFYFKARMPMPPAAWYDGFPELEDGIGMIRRFEEKWKNFEFPKPGGPKKETHIAVPCGQMVSSWMQKAADTLRIPNLYIHILPVVNQWFGSGINVTGLLTAGDILCAVQKMPFKADGMILPEVILRKGEKVFLDDVTFDDFADRIGYPVKICRFADDFLETLYLWE